MFVYPRLSRSIAEVRIEQLPEDDLGIEFGLEDPQAAPVETGSPVPVERLRKVREAVLTALDQYELRGLNDPALWDALVGEALFESMDISPADASSIDVWSFLTLVVLPDVAVQRFPSRHPSRLIGAPRNVFRRTWWRRYVLGAIAIPDGVKALGEDELVNIFERTKMARDHRLVRLLAAEILSFRGNNRSAFARQLALRVRALSGALVLELVDEEELVELIREISKELASQRARQP